MGSLPGKIISGYDQDAYDQMLVYKDPEKDIMIGFIVKKKIDTHSHQHCITPPEEVNP